MSAGIGKVLANPGISLLVCEVALVVCERNQRGDLQRAIQRSLLCCHGSFGDKMIQTKEFLSVEEKEFLEENKKRSSDPEAVVCGNNEIIYISVFRCHTF